MISVLFWDVALWVWYLVTEVTGQTLSPTFKGKVVQHLALEEVTNKLSRNVRMKLPFCAPKLPKEPRFLSLFMFSHHAD